MRDLDTPLIFGSYDFVRADLERWHTYNALFWMDRDGQLRDYYYKHKLIPLGEYVPFSERLGRLIGLLPIVGWML